MTQEEEIIFLEKITETILPIALNMTEEQIKSVIDGVKHQDDNISEDFANMLYEQIMIQKYNIISNYK